MKLISVYRNGYISANIKDENITFTYSRNSNKVSKSYRGNYFNSIDKFRKFVDTEGF